MRFRPYLLSLLWINGLCIGGSDRLLYVYPIAAFKLFGTQHMLVLKQWSPQELELSDWNITTGSMNKILMSMYTPAAVTLLPDKSGFSFVDNGRIRIKRFEKRAVKSLDIYDPVYGIELIHWIDNQTCYFHAQSDGRYGIYTLTMEEELTLIMASSFLIICIPTLSIRHFFILSASDLKKILSIGLAVIP